MYIFGKLHLVSVSTEHIAITCYLTILNTGYLATKNMFWFRKRTTPFTIISWSKTYSNSSLDIVFPHLNSLNIVFPHLNSLNIMFPHLNTIVSSFKYPIPPQYTTQSHTLYCLVMELAEGGELLTHVKSNNEFKRLEEPKARPYVRQLISALYYMHSKGIVHR